MIIAIIFLCIFFLFILICKVSTPMCYDNDEEVVVTTTTTEHGINVVGNLKRQVDNRTPAQSYVIDPVDGQQIWLNSNDDMYEDADGKVWRLI